MSVAFDPAIQPCIITSSVSTVERFTHRRRKAAERVYDMKLEMQIGDVRAMANDEWIPADAYYRKTARDWLALEAEVRRHADCLRALAMAADVLSADQAAATDPRCGLVQPVSVAECEELNAALRAAWLVLTEDYP